jgi:hypothetical protein
MDHALTMTTEPFRMVDGRCPGMPSGRHVPHDGRAGIADLTDHPRGMRYARGVAYGATVWVTRCTECRMALICLAPYEAPGDPPIVRELRGAELSPAQNRALDAQYIGDQANPSGGPAGS